MSKKIIIGLFALLVLSACSPKKGNQKADDSQTTQSQDGGSDTLAEIRERGALKVGLSAFNPWAMQSTTGGWIGFEVDVATKLATDLGVELELVPTAWAGIIPALLTSKFDVIIGGMSVTPERAEQVTFSQPYEYSKTVLLLNKDLEGLSQEELDAQKYSFVGRAGSTPFVLTKELFPNAQFKAFDDDGLSLQDLLNGQADGFMTTSIEAAIGVEENPERVYIPGWARELKKEDVAFALPKNVEQAWLDTLNKWIEVNWANGFLEEKAQYWFESRDWTKDHQISG